MKRGALIVLEGTDKVGKSTAAVELMKQISSVGKKAKLFQFPDVKTPVGMILADLLGEETSMKKRATHLLFAANRWEREDDMVTALNAGFTVIVDRYLHSGVAYASCALEQNLTGVRVGSMEWARKLNNGLPKPDLVCLLDAEPDSTVDRPGWEDETQQVKDASAAVREQFLQMRDHTWLTVDASRPKEIVADRLFGAVIEEMLKEREGEVGRIQW